MYYSQISMALLATATVILAQDLSSLSEIPTCAQTPAKNAFIASGCALNDAKCICGSKDFKTQLTDAALADCQPEDQLKLLKFATDFCTKAGVTLDIPQTTLVPAVEAALATSAAAADPSPEPSSTPEPTPTSEAPAPAATTDAQAILPEQATTSTTSYFIAPAFAGILSAPAAVPSIPGNGTVSGITTHATTTLATKTSAASSASTPSSTSSGNAAPAIAQSSTAVFFGLAGSLLLGNLLFL